MAGYWLFRLVSSPRQKRFARCSEAGCGRYFVYTRAPERRYETRCPRHKNAGAKRRVYASRKQQHERKVNAAAKHWLAWRPEYGDRSKWVADKAQCDKGLRINDEFGKRFVTTHSTEIEEASKVKNMPKTKEGEHHATGKN